MQVEEKTSSLTRIIYRMKRGVSSLLLWGRGQRIKTYQAKYTEISDITGIAQEPKRMSVPRTAQKVTDGLKNGADSDIIRYKYNSIADPMREVYGSGENSHPNEIKQFREEISRLGVELIEHDYENLGYIPSLKVGYPGTIYVSKGASYSAWCHEIQHMRDDYADGWAGIRILQDLDKCYEREAKAYQIEIDMAIEANRPDISKRLTENLEKERKRIYGEEFE